jgi:HlyD family secretion protein
MKRWVYILLGAVLVAAVLIGLVSARRGRAQAAIEEIQTVEAATGPLTALVGATGTVRANQSAVLAFETSGIVGSFRAELGDRVREGAVLAELETASLPQQVILAHADLVAAQRALDDLLNSGLAAAQAQLALAQAQDELHDAEYDRIVNQEGNRASAETIDIAEARVVLAQQRADQARDLYNRFSGADANDPNRAYALTAYASARDELRSAQRALNWYLGAPNEIDQALFDADVAIAQARLDDAQREWDRLRDGPDPADIDAAQARVDAAQATIDLARIVAPFDGTITSVAVMPGDLVTAGTVAVGLADFSRLLVDVDVSEVDINRIQRGQDVSLTFDAVPARTYSGRVTDVGLAGVQAQGVVNFPVTVEILDPDESVRPGMTAAVNIVVEQIEGVLLVPNRAVRARDGQRVVYVLRDGAPVAVSIVLGASSDTESQVVEGDLAAGDLIVLNPPIELEQGGPGSFFGQ